MTNWNGILCVSALIGVLFVPLAGCGGDDDTSGSSSGGKGGSKAGSSGSGTELAGTGGSSGAAGGGNSINDLINMFTMCDANATNVDSCGDETCPAPASGGLTGCTVSCCTSDNHCGTKNANAALAQFTGTGCTVPAQADPRCPGVNLGPMSLPGCCDANNQCGQLIGTTCASGAAFGGFGGAPRTQACDAANGGDAGVENDAGR